MASTAIGVPVEANRRPTPAARIIRITLGLVLVLVMLVGGPVGEGHALRFPWTRSDASEGPPAGSARRTSLQEVAPPPAVQRMRDALSERRPSVEILSPRDDAVLGPGPWTVRLGVSDWPIAEAGDLGLGTHLVVQLDGDPPRRLSSLETTLPPLTPGSHRLTVYAARPWGEAVKSPGAVSQIRLHRAAANPISLPEKGSAQLIPVSPVGEWSGEPVLLDWLLLDAPLQDLRPGDSSWRLRVTVNGDSLLLDRQTPLWLKGWPEGTSAMLLELVDSRGDPLNPPFNSVVTELTRTPSAARPPWLDPGLSPEDQERLLGLRPAEPAAELPPEGGRDIPESGDRSSPGDGPEAMREAGPAPGVAEEPATDVADVSNGPPPGDGDSPAGEESDQKLDDEAELDEDEQRDALSAIESPEAMDSLVPDTDEEPSAPSASAEGAGLNTSAQAPNSTDPAIQQEPDMEPGMEPKP